MVLSRIIRGPRIRLVEAQRFVTTRLAALGEEQHPCFDYQYLHLLGDIRAKGERSSATKGPHRQAPRESAITIDLAEKRADNQGCGNFLPLTSLRFLDFKHVASEALWYLRGEDNIKFLLRHNNPFWVKVAGDDPGLFVGLNYGLLTCFPQEDGMEPINQLEEKVIARLVEGQCSRNMTCILHKPGQSTKQEACTSTCSFICRRSDGSQGAESLDMVLHQRSSDVAVGLVWDVAVWALILHLVCREVGLRTHGRRQLEAGRLTFNLVSAHYYDKNAGEVDLVLQREPLPNNCPRFILGEQAAGKSLYAIAEDDDSPNWLTLSGYHAHPAIHIEPAN
jgi:thymidylate synthase